MYETLDAVVRRKRVGRASPDRARIRLCLRENAPTAALRALSMLLFFFLSVSECFRVPSPFAVCALTAFAAMGYELLFPALGLAVSLALRAAWGLPLDLMQYAGCALICLSALRPPKSASRTAAYAAAALSLRLFAAMFSPVTEQEFILRAVSVLVGAGCAPAFYHTLQLSARRVSRVGADDLLCAVLLCAVLLCGAGRVALWRINIGLTLSGAAILCCACVGGCTAAVCAGLVCGISLSLCGHADGYVVCYAFTGILCGLFYGRKRGVLCAVYLLGSAFTSYAVQFSLDIPFIGAAAIACAVFLLLPRRLITAAYALGRRLSPDAKDMEGAYAQFMRAQWTANLRLLSRLLPEVRVPEPEEDERLEDIMQRLCAGCEHMPACWQTHGQETRAALRAYFLSGERAEADEACVRAELWPRLLLEERRAEQQRAQRAAYMRREREAARTHLSAVAQAMARFSQEGGRCDRGADALAGEAAFLLRRMRVSGRVLYALRVNQHISIALRYEPQLTAQRQIDRYCEELSRQLNAHLRVAMRQKDMVLLEETPPLMTESYHLSAAASDGDGENGDSVLLKSSLGGVEIMMLSDGMGHGAQARAESEKTLELLCVCMDAGYTVEAALAAINCVMLSCTDGEEYATVDLCVTDLWQGAASIHKLGACPSILLSGDSLRVLKGGTLPLGVLPDIKTAAHGIAVADGDMLIQFSDGLSDACGGMHALEKQVELLMRDKAYRSPETVAESLMAAAIRRSGGALKDDITVLCTLFKNSRRKKDRRADADERSAVPGAYGRSTA